MSNYSRTGSSTYTYTQTEVPLYGSDRVGIFRPNLVVFPNGGACKTCSNPCGCISCTPYQFTININNANGVFDRRIAQKEFELKDHLGDVRVTISDRRRSGTNSDSVLSYNNYYAFGMELVGGNMIYNASNYDYAYNGKLHDDDWKSNGNSYDYGFRIYDPRLGRFMSVDPYSKKYPELSTYQFASNTPIVAKDLDGKETLWRPGTTPPDAEATGSNNSQRELTSWDITTYVPLVQVQANNFYKTPTSEGTTEPSVTPGNESGERLKTFTEAIDSYKDNLERFSETETKTPSPSGDGTYSVSTSYNFSFKSPVIEQKFKDAQKAYEDALYKAGNDIPKPTPTGDAQQDNLKTIGWEIQKDAAKFNFMQKNGPSPAAKLAEKIEKEAANKPDAYVKETKHYVTPTISETPVNHD